MSQHQLSSGYSGDANERFVNQVTTACGCRIIYGQSEALDSIEWCPLHAQAPAMREILADLTDAYEEAYEMAFPNTGPSFLIPKARALLKTIEP